MAHMTLLFPTLGSILGRYKNDVEIISGDEIIEGPKLQNWDLRCPSVRNRAVQRAHGTY
jgi:hypothetical protein